MECAQRTRPSTPCPLPNRLRREIVDYLRACTSAPASPENLAYVGCVYAAIDQALEDGTIDPLVFSVNRLREITPAWYAIIAAAEHAICFSDTCSASELNARITWVAARVRSAIRESDRASMLGMAS